MCHLKTPKSIVFGADAICPTNSVLLLEVVELFSNHRLQLDNNSYSQGLISAHFFK